VLLSDVELGLGGADGLVEVIVIEGRVEDLVTVLDQVGRLHAAGDRMPAVEEQELHGRSKLTVSGRSAWRTLPAYQHPVHGWSTFP
jgi:hypothetical protein